ncbi:MAG: hypothetical protein COT45_01320 [bacterium (Candidatus Stahlbacteria) CG08_land_8_20_14_0_20_40_26]|nr:MAG: hypothetical protein COT45_01320 [bacterium (Candidatus Stahlbacteria) CG08_land_8_20_14_0_20_40_26]
MDENNLIKRKSPRLKEFDYCEARPYFITICTKDKIPYFENQKIAKKVIECLLSERKQMGYLIFAYCLMPDHLHILLMPDSAQQSDRTRRDRASPCPKKVYPGPISISQFIGAFKSKSTHLFWKCKGTGKLWQGRFYDHIVRSNENLVKTADYILQNPVRKGIVERANAYPYSGLVDEIPM